MLDERIPVAREGVPFIGASAFLTLLCAILGYAWPTLLLLLVTTFIMMFFRDPERIVPREKDAIVSPADGKVIVAEKVVDERFSAEQTWKISVFMNVFNVHVNRIPCAATVTRVHHVPGAFLAADNQDAHLKNEYCAITLKTDTDAELTVVQIAGLIARRIVCRAEPGDRVTAGERYGLIRFGSRLDIYLPNTAEVAVRPGETVRAGESILARLS